MLFAYFSFLNFFFIPVLTKTTLAEVRHIMNLNFQEFLLFWYLLKQFLKSVKHHFSVLGHLARK